MKSSSPHTPLDSQALAKGMADCLAYIRHVGANQTMRGEPHPQQWLVDWLESTITALHCVPPDKVLPSPSAIDLLKECRSELSLVAATPRAFDRLPITGPAILRLIPRLEAFIKECEQ